MTLVETALLVTTLMKFGCFNSSLTESAMEQYLIQFLRHV